MENIELKDSFEDYAVNELVNKLHEFNPEDYESQNGEQIDVEDLLDLLLEDKYENGCYYIYTKDNEKVFKEYLKNISRIFCVFVINSDMLMAYRLAY